MNGSKVTYHQQVSYCGKPRCRKCREGTGHGPYWYAYTTVEGRTTRSYVGKDLPPEKLAEMQGGPQPPLTPYEREREQSTIRIYALGQFRLERKMPHGGWQTVTEPAWQHQRVRSLLGCLISTPGRKLNREQIMEALSPELEMEAAASRLDRSVYSLRQLFEPRRDRLATSPLLLTEREVLVLAEHPQVWVDADVFDALLTKAHATEDPGEEEHLLEEASRLYGGDFWPEERKLEMTLTRREALQRAQVSLLLRLADLRTQRDSLATAFEPLEKLMALDPTNEAAVQRFMRIMAQLDRRGEALRAYLRLKEWLAKEYTIKPLPETTALYDDIRGRKKLSATPATPTNPDPGRAAALERAHDKPKIPIGRSHQSPLVGREQEMEMLLRLITTTGHAAKYKLGAQKHLSSTLLATQRTPQCVLLLGDVGIGKTRLAEEASRDARDRGWAVAWSRVYTQEGSIPYRLWTDILHKAME